MKYRLPIMAAIILLLAIALSGCGGKTYFFSFKNEQDFANTEGTWVSELSNYTFNSNGLKILDGNIACPLRFSGNITMTVRFWVKASVDYTYWIGISLGDGTWFDTSENELHIEMENVGAPDEYYTVSDNDAAMQQLVHYQVNALTPGLNRNGYNEYVLNKVGEHFTISLNGVEYADFDLGYYDSEWFGPNLMSSWNDSVDDIYGVTFESIRVVYSGETSLMPLPPP
jgi:hypothetical protein